MSAVKNAVVQRLKNICKDRGIKANELADEYMIDESDLVVIVGSSDQNNSLRKYAESMGVKVEYFSL